MCDILILDGFNVGHSLSQVKFLRAEQIQVAWQFFRALYLRELASSNNSIQSSTDSSEVDEKSEDVNFTAALYVGDSIQGSEADDEFSRYQSLKPSASLSTDPILWWQAHESEFPTIARLARRILCIPASSAPSERAFSVIGAVNTKVRTNLHVDRLPELATCKHNLAASRTLGIDMIDITIKMMTTHLIEDEKFENVESENDGDGNDDGNVETMSDGSEEDAEVVVLDD